MLLISTSLTSSAQRHITQFFAQHTPFPQVTVHKHRRPRVLERWLGYAESIDPALQWELVAYQVSEARILAQLAADQENPNT